MQRKKKIFGRSQGQRWLSLERALDFLPLISGIIFWFIFPGNANQLW